MADETTGATGTLADPDTQPPAGSSATQADAGTDEKPKAPENVSLEDAKKLRSENKSLRDRLKALEDERTKADEAKLSETERLTKRNADLEHEQADRDRKAQERVLKHAARAEALRIGIEPDLAYRLLDHSAIEFDEDGEPSNVADQLDKLAKTYPNLISGRAGSADGGVRGRSSLTLEQIKKFTPAEYEKHRDEVHAFLAARRT